MTAAAGPPGLAAVARRPRRWPPLVGAPPRRPGIADDVSGGPHVVPPAAPPPADLQRRRRGGRPRRARARSSSSPTTTPPTAASIFSPAARAPCPPTRFPDWYDRQETSPQLMLLVAAGPALVALGALTGLGPLRAARDGPLARLGGRVRRHRLAPRRARRQRQPLRRRRAARAGAGAARASRSSGVRVLLVSTGSEESFMEGMRGFARRHFAALPRETHRGRLPGLGRLARADRHRGRGHAADARLHARAPRPPAARSRRAPGVHLRRGLRLGLATDGLIALKAGYRERRDRLGHEVQAARSTTTPPRHAGRTALRHRARRGDALRGARARQRPGSALARPVGAQRAGERLLAGGDLAGEAGLLERARAARRAAGPGRCRARAASSSPRTSGACGPAARSANACASISRASSRWAAIAGSALRPRVARRSATVNTVTSAA